MCCVIVPIYRNPDLYIGSVFFYKRITNMWYNITVLTITHNETRYIKKLYIGKRLI